MTPDAPLSDDLIEIVGNRSNTAPHPRGIMLSDPGDPAGWAIVALVSHEDRGTPELRVYPTKGLEQLTSAADAFALQVISREVAEQKYADLFALIREVLPKLAGDARPLAEPMADEEIRTSPFEAPLSVEPMPELPRVVTEWRPILRDMTAELTAVTVAALERGRSWLRKLRPAEGRSSATLPTGMPAVMAHDFVVRPSAPQIIKPRDAVRVAPGYVVPELVRPTAPRKPRMVPRKRPKASAGRN